MHKIKWHISDPEIRYYMIHSNWLDNAVLVKENNNRTIYRICIGKNAFYIKHDHPNEIRHIVKSFIFPKAKSEFNSGLLLNRLDIPTIPVIGWGKRGIESFFISKGINNSIVLKDLLQRYYNSKKDINNILTHIKSFLRILVEKGVDHPDLHAGNILVKEKKDGFSFYLVDLYGIKICKRNSLKRIFKIFAWLITIIWPFDWEYIENFLYESGFAQHKIKDKWERMVKLRVDYIKSRCRKRREKLFKNSSLCKKFYLDKGKITIRTDLAIKKPAKCYILKELSHEMAIRCWTNSYFLSLFGIPVAACFAYLEDQDKYCIIKYIPIYISNINNLNYISLSKYDKNIEFLNNIKSIKRFLWWINVSNISVSLEPDSIYVMKDSVFPLFFLNPEKFIINGI